MDNTNERQQSNTQIPKHWKIIIVILATLALSYLIANYNALTEQMPTITNAFNSIIIGAAIAFTCNPILVFCERKILKYVKKPNIKRALAVVLTMTILIGILILLVVALIPRFIQSCIDIAMNLDTYIDHTISWLNTILHSASFEQYIDADSIINILSDFFSDSSSLAQTLLSYASAIGSAFIDGVSNILFGLIFAVYMLLAKDRLLAQANKLVTSIFPKKVKDFIIATAVESDRIFEGYIVGSILDSLVVSVFSYILYVIVGIENPIFQAVLAGITNFIPVIGPWLGAIPAAFLVILSQPDKLLALFIIIVIVQQIDGNIIKPLIVGDTTGISAFGVLASVVIMNHYFGIIGMFLGVPIFAIAIKVISNLCNASLSAKGEPTSLIHYYSKTALVVPEEKHHHSHKHDPVVARFCRWLGKISAIAFKKIGYFFAFIWKKALRYPFIPIAWFFKHIIFKAIVLLFKAIRIAWIYIFGTYDDDEDDEIDENLSSNRTEEDTLSETDEEGLTDPNAKDENSDTAEEAVSSSDNQEIQQ